MFNIIEKIKKNTLVKKEEEFKHQVKLTQIIINSSDPEELKNKITKAIASALDASRCFFIEYDSSTNNFKKITNAYTTERKDLNILGYDMEKDTPNFAMKQKYMKTFISKDTRIFIKENKLEGSQEEAFLKKFNVKAAITVRLEFGEKFLGILVVHYDVLKPQLEDFDLKFLQNAAEYISIALHLSILYDEEKTKKEKERILRSIISIMSSDYNLNQITQKIFDIMATIYNAQSASINISVDDFERFYRYDSSNPQSIEIKEKTNFTDADIYKSEKFNTVKNKVHYIPDTHNFIVQKNLENSEIETYFEKNNIKSLILLPILYENIDFGLLTIHFDKMNPITQDNLNFIKTIVSQLAIAIKQSLNYEKEKENAEKEALLRKITENIRSSLEIKEIFNFVCEEVAKSFDVQRTVIAHYQYQDGQKISDIKREYRTSPDIKSIDQILDYSKTREYWFDNIMGNRQPICFDNIEEADVPEFFKNDYKFLGVKSIIATPIKKGDDIWGVLILFEYDRQRHWTDEEKNLLEIIAGQVYVALNQAELYENEKKLAKRESILRRVIESSRKSLKYEDVMMDICKEISDLFNFGRITIAKIPLEPENETYISFEHIADKKMKPAKATRYFEPIPKYWKNHFVQGKGTKIVSNIDESDFPEDVKNTYKDLGVGSLVCIPIGSEELKWGAMFLSRHDLNVEYSEEEIDLLETIASQIFISVRQSEIYENEKKTAEREAFLRKIIECARSSMDIREVQKQLIYEIGRAFKADRCYFRSYLEKEDEFLVPDIEYLASDSISSLKDVEPDYEALKYFVRQVEKQKKGFYPIIVNEEIAKNTPLERYLKSVGIKADYAIPITGRQDQITWLLLHYVEKDPNLCEEDKKLLETIAYQIDIAFEQLRLYNVTKKNIEREEVIKQITDKIRSSLELDQTLSFICNECLRTFNVQRAAITSFTGKISFEESRLIREEKVIPRVKGLADLEKISDVTSFWGHNTYQQAEPLAIDNIDKPNLPDNIRNTYKEMGVKSLIGVNIRKGNESWGTLVLSEYNNYRKWSNEEKTLLGTIANQIYIAINQAELFTETKKSAEKESLLRRITEAMRSSLAIEEIKNKIVTNLGETFKADICAILIYQPENNGFIIDESSQYRSSKEDLNIVPNDSIKNAEWFVKTLKNFREINYENLDNFITANGLQGTFEENFLREQNVKSGYNVSIYYGNELLGCIALNYTREYRKLEEDDLEVLRSVATQAGIALHQAHLYEITIEKAETEKFNRRILEILRNTLDKETIKSLFVRNIGQYFKADRVFFSDYNAERKIFLPYDKKSEYLSSPNEKSFVGYDWSNDEAREYIQPLLEKRELKIYCWDDYIKDNPHGEDFISLFKSANVKSSYNLPVVYEGNLMGYFCIEFTQQNCKKLTEEEINRIRSMCTQAAIALYHAELFVRAQKTATSKDELIENLAIGANAMLENIMEISDAMSQTESMCEKHIEHLNHINEIAKQLLECAKSINEHKAHENDQF